MSIRLVGLDNVYVIPVNHGGFGCAQVDADAKRVICRLDTDYYTPSANRIGLTESALDNKTEYSIDSTALKGVKEWAEYTKNKEFPDEYALSRVCLSDKMSLSNRQLDIAAPSVPKSLKELIRRMDNDANKKVTYSIDGDDSYNPQVVFPKTPIQHEGEDPFVYLSRMMADPALQNVNFSVSYTYEGDSRVPKKIHVTSNSYDSLSVQPLEVSTTTEELTPPQNVPNSEFPDAVTPAAAGELPEASMTELVQQYLFDGNVDVSASFEGAAREEFPSAELKEWAEQPLFDEEMDELSLLWANTDMSIDGHEKEKEKNNDV